MISNVLIGGVISSVGGVRKVPAVEQTIVYVFFHSQLHFSHCADARRYLIVDKPNNGFIQ